MCLILFAYQISEQYPLVLAANRDEFYQRPTAPLQIWEENPELLAGRDLEQGGTWFGINRSRRCFAGLTNFRDPAAIKADAPSRGHIIIDYLTDTRKTADHLASLQKTAACYNGFNLLLGDTKTLYWFSNVKNEYQQVPPGIHGLSNHFLDTPWPKVKTGCRALEAAVQNDAGLMDGGSTPDVDALFSLLKDTRLPEDHLLPDTGVGKTWERMLSPLFIQSPGYGTRSSTVMLAARDGGITVIERTWDPEDAAVFSECRFSI